MFNFSFFNKNADKADINQSEVNIASDDARPAVLFGYAVILLFFGGLGGWAAVATLASAVIAPGTIVVETNRKTIQHYEGGIVREILVEESTPVKTGDVLVRLESTQAQASEAVIGNQLYSNVAREARLVAERDRKETITFPDEILIHSNDPSIKTVMNDQITQFEERRTSLNGQIEILTARVSQSANQIDGLTSQKNGMEEQIKIFQEELVGLNELYEEGFYPRSRILAMDREIARLKGEVGNIIAQIAKTEDSKNEARLQVEQIKQSMTDEIITELRDARTQIADLRERHVVAEDVLKRIDIIATQPGIIQNLKIHTVGGVIRAGQELMEIVPSDDTLIIRAKVSPLDIDNVHPGLKAEIRLSAFSTRGLPTILGEVQSISPDQIFDEMTREYYFQSNVIVDETSIPDDIKDRISPGMPAEVVIGTGERTVLDYLMSPITDILVRSFREE